MPGIPTQTTPSENLQIFAGRRGWQLGILVPALVLGVFVIWLGLSWSEIAANGSAGFPIDFRVFWAAGRLAHLGEPLSAFNVDSLTATHNVIKEDDWMPWSYPPAFLATLQPLGALPFPIAWLIFSIASIVAMIFAARPFAEGITPVWFAFALPPAVLPTLFMGQTTALWMAGLLAALAALKNQRLALAGFFIGLLTLKPQLGILIPFALLACRAWPTIISAGVTTLVISGLATALYGFEYWLEMRNMMAVHFSVVRETIVENNLMLSSYSTLASFGLPEPAALAIQWTITACAAIMVTITWRSPRISFDLRAAVLVLAVMLSTPYLWFYESALIAAAGLFLLRAGVLTNSPLGLALAGAMWMGATPAFFAFLFRGEAYISIRLLFTPLLYLSCLVCIGAVVQRLRAPDFSSANDKVFQ